MINTSIRKDLNELKKAKSIYVHLNEIGFDLLIPLKEMNEYPRLKEGGKQTYYTNEKDNKRQHYIRFTLNNDEEYSKFTSCIHELFDNPITLYEEGKLTKEETVAVNEYYEWWYNSSLEEDLK